MEKNLIYKNLYLNTKEKYLYKKYHDNLQYGGTNEETSYKYTLKFNSFDKKFNANFNLKKKIGENLIYDLNNIKDFNLDDLENTNMNDKFINTNLSLSCFKDYTNNDKEEFINILNLDVNQYNNLVITCEKEDRSLKKHQKYVFKYDLNYSILYNLNKAVYVWKKTFNDLNAEKLTFYIKTLNQILVISPGTSDKEIQFKCILLPFLKNCDLNYKDFLNLINFKYENFLIPYLKDFLDNDNILNKLVNKQNIKYKQLKNNTESTDQSKDFNLNSFFDMKDIEDYNDCLKIMIYDNESEFTFSFNLEEASQFNNDVLIMSQDDIEKNKNYISVGTIFLTQNIDGQTFDKYTIIDIDVESGNIIFDKPLSLGLYKAETIAMNNIKSIYNVFSNCNYDRMISEQFKLFPFNIICSITISEFENNFDDIKMDDFYSYIETNKSYIKKKYYDFKNYGNNIKQENIIFSLEINDLNNNNSSQNLPGNYIPWKYDKLLNYEKYVLKSKINLEIKNCNKYIDTNDNRYKAAIYYKYKIYEFSYDS